MNHDRGINTKNRASDQERFVGPPQGSEEDHDRHTFCQKQSQGYRTRYVGMAPAVVMIDARKWQRPPPEDIQRRLDETGLTGREIADRLGIDERRLGQWVAQDVKGERRRISYLEWLGLMILVDDRRDKGSTD